MTRTLIAHAFNHSVRITRTGDICGEHEFQVWDRKRIVARCDNAFAAYAEIDRLIAARSKALGAAAQAAIIM
jgi:hypothetical protein